MQKHFVQFHSPGTFFAEISEKPIDEWDVEAAKKMAASIRERYGATPYGFRFTTRSRKENELDSSESAASNFYFLGGKVLTLADVKKRNDPRDETLIQNMVCNKMKRVIENTNSYKVTLPINPGDVVLDYKVIKKPKTVRSDKQ